MLSTSFKLISDFIDVEKKKNWDGEETIWKAKDQLESHCISSCVCLPWVYAVSQGRQKENNGAPVCRVRLKSGRRVNSVVGRGEWAGGAGGAGGQEAGEAYGNTNILLELNCQSWLWSLWERISFWATFHLPSFTHPGHPSLPLPTHISPPLPNHHRSTTARSFHVEQLSGWNYSCSSRYGVFGRDNALEMPSSLTTTTHQLAWVVRSQGTKTKTSRNLIP